MYLSKNDLNKLINYRAYLKKTATQIKKSVAIQFPTTIGKLPTTPRQTQNGFVFKRSNIYHLSIDTFNAFYFEILKTF